MIRALFLAGDMQKDIRDEILAAYGELTNDQGAVAVRSSATAEDLPDASFAGQQGTYLNVQGQAALLEAVIKCWASLWTARALAYRLRQGIDPAHVSLAVVVQRLVPADTAGILFTANPLDGNRDQMVINATWGLGEAIVGGQVTPDTVIVDKSTRQLETREKAQKTVMTVRTDGGTEEQPVPDHKQNQSALEDATAIQLVELGAEIEAHFGAPMDIEWAITGDEIAILQARPITNLPPAPLNDVQWEPPTPGTIWFRRQIVEHMPEPLSPLFEDLYLRQGLDYSLHALLDAMGELSTKDFDIDAILPQGFADTINGYAYTTGSFNISGRILLPILQIYAQLPQFLKLRAFNWDEVVLPEYLGLIDRWGALDLTRASDEDLLNGISEMAAGDSKYWFGSAVYLGFSRVMDPVFDRVVKSPFVGYVIPQQYRASSAFLRGFDSRVLDAQADLEILADVIRGSENLRQLVQQTPADQLLGALGAHPDNQPILEFIERYFDEYGHQIYNLDFVDPTQNEDPLPILVALKSLVDSAPDPDVRARQAQMAAEREALVAGTARALNPLSRRLFAWAWQLTERFAPYRESVMFYMGAAWPTVRKLAAELGRRLTEAGSLENSKAIYFLTSAEIMEAIEARKGGKGLPALAEVAEERRDLREARKRLDPPPRVPERGTLKFGPISLAMFDPTPSEAGLTGPVLKGHAVSQGQVTAPASIIRSIEDFDRMEPGSILVCATTTPAWTPLFSQAVGLVTDVGGALAHGSIVAREYGIPAVMGTGVASQRIEHGELIRLDGDQGTVTLVERIDPAEEQRLRAQEEAEQRRAAARRRKKFAAVLLGAALVMFLWRRRRRKNI